MKLLFGFFTVYVDSGFSHQYQFEFLPLIFLISTVKLGYNEQDRSVESVRYNRVDWCDI